MTKDTPSIPAGVGISRRGILALGGGLAGAAALAALDPRQARAAMTPAAASFVNTGARAAATASHYPAAAFMHVNPGAKFIDITKVEESLGAPAGTNAVAGDPSVDCAVAFNYILDWYAAKLRALPDVRDAQNRVDLSYAIYVPEGTFHVHSTIQYSGPVITIPNSAVLSAWIHMRILGAHRDRSVIRLVDGATGFGAGEQRAVIDYSQAATFDNWSAQNILRDVTVHTGSGNPGAIAVDFFGANNAAIDRVAIVSGDGQGVAGLQFPIGITSGYYSDILVDGFDYGIEMREYHFISPTMEHITVRNQRVAGVLVGDCLPTLRDLVSENSVPAVQIVGAGAHVVLIDSALRGGSATTPAIDFQTGHLFARNVESQGYRSTIEQGSTTLVRGAVDEYVSGPVFRFDEHGESRSMGLKIEEIPDAPWPAHRDWANVDDYGAAGAEGTDDTAAIQAALNSGRTVVYFPKQAYWVSGTLQVPPQVERIEGTFSSILSTSGEPIFRVASGGRGKPLTIIDLHRSGGPNSAVDGTAVPLVDHAMPRTLSLRNIRTGGALGGQLYRGRAQGRGGDLFFTNTNGHKAPTGELRNQKVWMRWENTEAKDVANHPIGAGAEVWVLGYKVEGGTQNFTVAPGAKLEVLGGVCNSYAPTSFGSGAEDVAFIGTGGEMTLVLASNGQDAPHPEPANAPQFHTVLRDTDGTTTKEIMWDELPERTGRRHQWVIPLYVHRTA
ncbi:hypothetical protein GCM10022200_21500 [Microbacterium awajiense]|uniref:Rhamnogalacturonase A/B/Epimerase-like pectate lyase domain-containing protein n=1 Tax=Microbacterium awajiense TaxID=415214 RepID=A0ABP7APT4_9MICO